MGAASSPSWSYPAGRTDLDLDDIGHECPMWGGAARLSRHMKRAGEWPPPAPAFWVQGDSLLRRFSRHLWLEAYAGFSAVVMIEAWPGVGKSLALYVLAKLVDPSFELETHFIYDGKAFLDAIRDPTPLVVLGLDEAAATFLFARDHAARSRREVIKDVWKFVRFNRKIIFVVAQNSRGLDWVFREDVSRWMIKIKKRDPISQKKLAELHHGIRVSIKATGVGRRGDAAGDATIFRFGQAFEIPPVSIPVLEAYNTFRTESLVEPRSEEP